MLIERGRGWWKSSYKILLNSPWSAANPRRNTDVISDKVHIVYTI